MQIDERAKKHISNVVFSLFKQYRNRNPFFIANSLGITCRFVDFNPELPAVSSRLSETDKGTIYINNNFTSSYAKKILCAHELGHLCLHKNDDLNLFDCKTSPIKEYEANYFAVLLLPQIIVNTDISKMSVETFNDYMSNKVLTFYH